MITSPPPPLPLAAPAVRLSIRQRLRRRVFGLLKAEDGTASVDFAICVPVIMAIFMASMESGMMMTRFVLLEQSVDMVMRNLRLGQYPNVTVDMLKDEICSRTIIMKDCNENLAIELMPISTTAWTLPSNQTSCVNRSEAVQPAHSFNPGQAHEIMLVRVCLAQDAIFPTTGLGLNLDKDADGAYELVAISAFVNEP